MKSSHGYWTYERCKSNAERFDSSSAWKRSDHNVWQIAKRKGWLHDFFPAQRKLAGYWTLERCKKSAEKYTSRFQWSKEESGAYWSAYRNGWLDECFPKRKTPANP